VTVNPAGPAASVGPGRDPRGFRSRGLQMTRIETFTDAAFAFALTLLVISLDPLRSFSDLGRAMMDIPAFLLSATLLMMFWWGHHKWSRRYGLDDWTSFVLSCALVFTVLVYVYPLRFMFGLMFAWIGQLTGLQLGSGSLTVSGPQDIIRLFAIYGVGFMAMSTTLLLLNVHAWRLRASLQLDAIEREITRTEIGVWLIMLSTGACSTAVALLLPPTMAGAPGWVYALLGVIMPLYGMHAGRRERVAAQQPTAVGAAQQPADGGQLHTSTLQVP
jgi:uncharacterized membrane protein